MGDKPEGGADLYIDDGPHNIEALLDTGNRGIIFDTPYNRHVVGTRAHTWEECEQIVLRDAAERGYEFQVSLPGLEHQSGRLPRGGQGRGQKREEDQEPA